MCWTEISNMSDIFISLALQVQSRAGSEENGQSSLGRSSDSVLVQYYSQAVYLGIIKETWASFSQTQMAHGFSFN